MVHFDWTNEFCWPRPALPNQYDLLALRVKTGVCALVSGLTGWAQINSRDELSVSVKVGYEVEYLKSQSMWFDIKILWLTILKVVNLSGVSH